MITNKNTPNFCFCTLAIGEEYRNLALLLAKDLEIHAPNCQLLILTDNQPWFVRQPNILALPYQPQSCTVHNDKRLVLVEALSRYESCIFLDADSRILDQVPENDLNFSPGIVAYSSCSFIKHNIQRKNKTMNPKKRRRIQLAKQYVAFHQLKLENIKFIQEYFFYVTKDSHFEEFIKQWEILAAWFESNGILGGEGHIIGLAAAKAGFPIVHDHEKKINLFKDRVAQVKIKQKQVDSQYYAQYFEQRAKMALPNQGRILRLIKKYRKSFQVFTRILRLRFRIFRDTKLSHQIYQFQKNNF